MVERSSLFFMTHAVVRISRNTIGLAKFRETRTLAGLIILAEIFPQIHSLKTATALTGEPVPPLIFKGNPMKRNLPLSTS